MKPLAYVNLILFITACVQALTGAVLALNGPEFFGIIHIYNAFLLSAMIVVHLALNWTWVKALIRRR